MLYCLSIGGKLQWNLNILITKDFLYPNNSKIYEKEPNYCKLILPVPWPLLYRGSTVMVACVAGAKRERGGRTPATQATVMIFL